MSRNNDVLGSTLGRHTTFPKQPDVTLNQFMMLLSFLQMQNLQSKEKWKRKPAQLRPGNSLQTQFRNDPSSSPSFTFTTCLEQQILTQQTPALHLYRSGLGKSCQGTVGLAWPAEGHEMWLRLCCGVRQSTQFPSISLHQHCSSLVPRT